MGVEAVVVGQLVDRGGGPGAVGVRGSPVLGTVVGGPTWSTLVDPDTVQDWCGPREHTPDTRGLGRPGTPPRVVPSGASWDNQGPSRPGPVPLSLAVHPARGRAQGATDDRRPRSVWGGASEPLMSMGVMSCRILLDPFTADAEGVTGGGRVKSRSYRRTCLPGTSYHASFSRRQKIRSQDLAHHPPRRSDLTRRPGDRRGGLLASDRRHADTHSAQPNTIARRPRTSERPFPTHTCFRRPAFRRRPSRTGRPARAHGQARGLAGFLELAPLWQHDPVFRRVVVHRSPHVVDPHAAVPKHHLGPRVTLPFRARIPRARRAKAPGLLHVQRRRRTVGGCAPRSATACRSALRSTAAGSPAAGVGKSGGVPIAPAGDEVLEGAPQLGQALALLRDRLAAAGTPGPGSGQSRSANTGA